MLSFNAVKDKLENYLKLESRLSGTVELSRNSEILQKRQAASWEGRALLYIRALLINQ